MLKVFSSLKNFLFSGSYYEGKEKSRRRDMRPRLKVGGHRQLP